MFLSLVGVVPLLMSAANGLTVFSNIMQRQLPEDVVERVLCDSSSSFSGKTNGSSNKNIAFNATVDYEVFKMGHNKLYTSWDNNYSIIFRVRVDLMKTVEYKDGWWIFASTKKADTTLSYITADLRVDTLPTDYNVIQIMPSSNRVMSCFEESQNNDNACAGDYYTSNGGFYIDMLYYYDVENGKYPSDGAKPIYSYETQLGVKGQYEHIKYEAHYDYIENCYYTAKSVFFYGALSFKGNSDPKNIKLNVEVGYGLDYTPNADSDTTKLSYVTIEDSGLTPRKTTYKYSNKSSTTINIL